MKRVLGPRGKSPLRFPDHFFAVLLIAIAILCAGCAARHVSASGNYRLAGLYLLPPDSPQQFNDVQQERISLGDLGAMPVEQPSSKCSIQDRWFSLSARKSGAAVDWTATVPLPAAWHDPNLISNGRSEWIEFFNQMSDLQNAGCMSRSAYSSASRTIAQSMPAPAMYSLFFRYSFGSQGYVDLVPGMRLFIERSIFRDESGDTNQVSNYVGERKTFYDVAGSPAKGIALRRDGVWRSKGLSSRAGAEYPDTGLSRQFAGMRALRLFVLTLFVPPQVRRNSLLVGVRNPQDMVRITRTIQKNPEIPCKQMPRDSVCASFDGVVSASVEMNVVVNGRRRYFPIGSTVETAMAAVSPHADAAALQTLRIRRLYRGAYRNVQFNPFNPELPKLALFAGDRISWKTGPP
ncbi:MAG TPA: hypothetical protein VFW94_01590 [Candidatus Acidoferrales bacterium]|nr:hypothetical protein [Candidatus Acidoferrales bacterium]